MLRSLRMHVRFVVTVSYTHCMQTVMQDCCHCPVSLLMDVISLFFHTIICVCALIHICKFCMFEICYHMCVMHVKCNAASLRARSNNEENIFESSDLRKRYTATMTDENHNNNDNSVH